MVMAGMDSVVDSMESNTVDSMGSTTATSMANSMGKFASYEDYLDSLLEEGERTGDMVDRAYHR